MYRNFAAPCASRMSYLSDEEERLRNTVVPELELNTHRRRRSNSAPKLQAHNSMTVRAMRFFSLSIFDGLVTFLCTQTRQATERVLRHSVRCRSPPPSCYLVRTLRASPQLLRRPIGRSALLWRPTDTAVNTVPTAFVVRVYASLICML